MTDSNDVARGSEVVPLPLVLGQAYSICMSPILNVLKPLTSMTHIWSKITEEDEEEEDFEIYGQLE